MNWEALNNLLENAAHAESSSYTAPALVCCVEKDGVPIYEYAAGWLDPEVKSRQSRPETLFDLASLTKLFTTTACLCLIEKGQLTLSTKLADLLPEFGESKLLGGAEDPITKQPLPIDPRWLSDGMRWLATEEITIQRLLTHTSGLPAWRSVYRSCGPVPSSSAIMRNADQAERARSALGALTAYPLRYPPGQDTVYSDVGYMLLGAVVAECYGNLVEEDNQHSSLATKLEKAILGLVLEPLGISAQFTPPDSLQSKIAPTELCSWRGRRLCGEVHDENAAGIGGVGGHAGLFGTAKDVARLGRLYIAPKSVPAGESRPATFLPSAKLIRQSVEEYVRTSDGERRGLGWMLKSESNPSCGSKFSSQSFGHTGYTGTSLWCDPTRSLSVVLLTNRVYLGRNPKAIIELRPKLHNIICEISD